MEQWFYTRQVAGGRFIDGRLFNRTLPGPDRCDPPLIMQLFGCVRGLFPLYNGVLSAFLAPAGLAMLHASFRQPTCLGWPPALGLALAVGTTLIMFCATAARVWAEPPAAVATAKTTPSADNPQAIAFFEDKIRPVLVEHCLECHGDDPDDLGGGLSLASADGWQRGGDSGPSVVPGSADDSRLIAALEYQDLEMPPDGRLPPQTVRDFRRWINQGAIDPRTANALPVPSPRSAVDVEAGRAFWSFQPPRCSEPPAVENAPWCRSPLDRFVLARLEQAQLAPSPEASPAALLRRVCYDLTGLPPSPELLDAFVADPSDRHYDRIVDSLLQSTAYAEHWARHWLDVARYADSNGSDFNATYHHAWRYRDYVVRSFASDKPFDQFVREQIAGDLMHADDRQQRNDQIVATGFLMLGAKMLSERNKDKLTMDVVDEQVDTVGRAFMGLTLGCARCHDHKFDPIPTEDYYALAGIFRNTITLEGESQKYVSTWVDVPLPADRQHVARVEAYEQQEAQLAKELSQAEARLKELRSETTTALPGVVLDDAIAKKVGPWVASTYSKPFINDGYLHDGDTNKGDCSLVFRTSLDQGQYEVRLAYAGSGNRAANVPVSITHGSGTTVVRVDQSRPAEIDGRWQTLGRFAFDGEADAVITISNAGTSGYVLADALHFLPIDADAAEPPSPTAAERQAEQEKAAAERLAEAQQAVQQLKQQIDRHHKDAPPPLPMAMAVRESGKADDAFVCIRGEVSNPGETVPRGFVKVCGADNDLSLPADQSGRLQLAEWIANPNHPLTARVIVNRVWMHLIGAGLVRTVDNFGELGDRPSHPELLDTLTVDLIRDGWSIRRLVRRIVGSQTYRQASTYRADAFAADPDNRLLWRAHRRRLPAEAIRDTLLIAAGRLDHTPTVQPMAGYGTLVTTNTVDTNSVSVGSSDRRSLYVPIIRGSVPTLLAVFDFADPDMLVGKRPETNVPSQALVMLNHPRVVELASQIAQRSEQQAQSTDERLQWLYKVCLQRAADEEDLAMFRSFLAAANDKDEAWRAVAQTLLASTEFRFLD